MKKSTSYLGILVSIIILSCSKGGDDAKITLTDAKFCIQIDALKMDICNIIGEQEAITYAFPTTDSEISEVSACATVTRSPLPGTAITVGQLITKSINFGTGCTLNSGNIVSGKIIISYVYETNSGAHHFVNFSFDNFYHNGIKIDGDNITKRIPTTATTEINMTLFLTLANGDRYQSVTDWNRMTVQGFNTLTLVDDVYTFNGNSVILRPDNIILENVILPELKVKMSCEVNKPEIVSGVITIDRDTGQGATINFGQGSCNNIASVTVLGENHDVFLRN